MVKEAIVVAPNNSSPLSLDDLKSRFAPFCRRRGVARLEVFGSLARGEPHHDVDLLVTFKPDVHPGWDFFDLNFDLNKELEDIRGCEVDLLTRRSVEQDDNH